MGTSFTLSFVIPTPPRTYLYGMGTGWEAEFNLVSLAANLPLWNGNSRRTSAGTSRSRREPTFMEWELGREHDITSFHVRREPTFMEWELETPPVKGELHVLNLPLWNGNLAQLGNKMLDKPALNLPLWNGNPMNRAG